MFQFLRDMRPPAVVAGFSLTDFLDLHERRATTKVVRETEAEAVAFVASKAIGLNPATSVSHIQLYHGNAELLMESLEVVQQIAAVILAAIKMEKPVLPELPEAEEPQSAIGNVHRNRRREYPDFTHTHRDY